MLTTKLMVNRKPAIQPMERQNIRTAVHSLEQRTASGERGLEIETELNRVTSRVGRLGTMHPTEAKPLKSRLRCVRQSLRPQIRTTQSIEMMTANMG
jgi:hypothetical protein